MGAAPAPPPLEPPLRRLTTSAIQIMFLLVHGRSQSSTYAPVSPCHLCSNKYSRRKFRQHPSTTSSSCSFRHARQRVQPSRRMCSVVVSEIYDVHYAGVVLGWGRWRPSFLPAHPAPRCHRYRYNHVFLVQALFRFRNAIVQLYLPELDSRHLPRASPSPHKFAGRTAPGGGLDYLPAGFNAVGGVLRAGVDGSNVVLVTGGQSRRRHRVGVQLSVFIGDATAHGLIIDITRAHDEVVTVDHVLLRLRHAILLEILRLDVGHGPADLPSIALDALQYTV